MIDSIVIGLISIPFILSFIISICMVVYFIFAGMYFVLTNKYIFISKLDSIFACETLAYNLWIICSSIMGLTYLLYKFDFINANIVYISAGLALYPATWYLIYVVDIWYSTYKEYQCKKSSKVEGK